MLPLCALLAGCSYPEIGFRADDTGVDTATIEDTFEPPADTIDAELADAEVETLATDACACGESERCLDGTCRPYASCAALHAAVPSLGNGVYTLDPDGAGSGAEFPAYCEMTDDGGGWTLALKLDGAKKTFAYDAALWTNDATLNPDSPALDTVEAKLASFSTMPFTALRLGMLEGTRRWMRINHTATSLRAVFLGPARATTAGRAEWTKLLADPRLQANCNAEGFNRDFTSTTTYAARARIGLFGNNELDCDSPDSYIGFGAGFVTPHMCVGAEPGIVVGNFNPLSCGGSAGNERATAAFGYVLLR